MRGFADENTFKQPDYGGAQTVVAAAHTSSPTFPTELMHTLAPDAFTADTQ